MEGFFPTVDIHRAHGLVVGAFGAQQQVALVKMDLAHRVDEGVPDALDGCRLEVP